MPQEYLFQVTISGPELEESLVLPSGVSTIGRQEGNEIHLNHPLVSRRHARLTVTAEECTLMDLGSANGTEINGERLEANAPVQMGSGIVVRIGPFHLTFEQIPVEPPPAEEPSPPQPVLKKTVIEDVPEIPVQPPPPPVMKTAEAGPDYSQPPPGLTKYSSRYLQYLPGIYHTDFMARFLAIFESILTPVEWQVDNFDLYLNPETTPEGFLPWLANWFSITFGPGWTVEQQREMLAEAHAIYARRGTKWALSRVLEIYTDKSPEILDGVEENEDPFTFTVKIPLTTKEVNRELIEQIIDANKPAHTNYKLLFKQKK
ncbi:MAG: phage tail protein I [Candidatus Promineifilaceae bacterium]